MKTYTIEITVEEMLIKLLKKACRLKFFTGHHNEIRNIIFDEIIGDVIPNDDFGISFVNETHSKYTVGFQVLNTHFLLETDGISFTLYYDKYDEKCEQWYEVYSDYNTIYYEEFRLEIDAYSNRTPYFKFINWVEIAHSEKLSEMKEAFIEKLK